MTPKLLGLYSLRAQIEALIALEEAVMAPPQPEVVGCPHPEDRRIVSHNMGEEPQFYCPECKSFVKGQA